MSSRTSKLVNIDNPHWGIQLWGSWGVDIKRVTNQSRSSNSTNKGDPRYKDLLKEKKHQVLVQKFQYVLALYCIFWAIWSKAEFDKSKFSTKAFTILKYNQIKRVATNIDFLLVPSFDVIHSSQTAAFELSLKTPHYHHLHHLMIMMTMLMLMMTMMIMIVVMMTTAFETSLKTTSTNFTISICENCRRWYLTDARSLPLHYRLRWSFGDSEM